MTLRLPTVDLPGAPARASRWWRTRGSDLDAHRELGGHELPLPSGLEIDWLGTAGFQLTYEGTSLVIDPYLTRAPVADLLRRKPLVPDASLLDRVLRPGVEVAAVAVGHTHFDHAVDAPAVVRRHGCPAFGSSSLTHLLGLHGLADHAITVEPRTPYEAGPFTLRFVPSVHSRLVAGVAVPSAGELTCDHLDHLSGQAYRCGQVWGIHIEVAGTTLYHQGSADFLADELTTGPVDVFLAGIAGRAWSPGYFPAVLAKLQPSVVVPTHYDDFFRPLDQELGFSFNVHLAGFVEEIEAVSRDIHLAVRPPVRPRPAG